MPMEQNRADDPPDFGRGPDVRVSPDRLIAVLTIATISGVVFGSAGMFYAIRAKIIGEGFDPTPMVVCWMFVLVAWLVGRLFRRPRRKSRSLASGIVSDAVRDLRHRDR
jgi:hypothetical protein